MLGIWFGLVIQNKLVALGGVRYSVILNCDGVLCECMEHGVVFLSLFFVAGVSFFHNACRSTREPNWFFYLFSL